MTDAISVDVVTLPHHEGLPLPSYKTEGAAGMDICAAVTETATIGLGERLAVPTGICVAIPSGYELQIRPRSGLALEHGITVHNAPGTVDQDFRGEIKVILINSGPYPFAINRGDRIAQAILAPVVKARWRPVEALDATTRGAGGFGSTGVGQKAQEEAA